MGNSYSKGDTIITCSTEEVTRTFFKDHVIVWHDPNANNKGNQELGKFCEVLIFTDWEKTKDFIQTTQSVCHVITSGELLVKEASEYKNVCNIYVLCGDKKYDPSWAKNYPKVSCIETNILNLISRIQQDLLEWFKRASSLKLNLPAFVPISNESEVNRLEIRHIINNREQAKKDFLSLSKAIYTDQNSQKLLSSFEKYYNEYNKSQILRWYTQDSFLAKVTNNCLRIATPDSIQYGRLPLQDLEQAIKDQYQAKSKNFYGLLYRGAEVSKEEWLHLKDNQDKEIEMHGFLSVSKDRNTALNFMQTDPSTKVFITIIMPRGPNEEEQGFAEMEEFSQEKEILFNVRSRFTVLETEDEYSQDQPYRHLVFLYGAQGFRKFMTEKNPIHQISNTSIVQERNFEMSPKLIFLSIKTGLSYGQRYLDDDDAPFLCVSAMDRRDLINIKGYLLTNSIQQQTPFYGYKCCNCQAKKQKSYYICTDCGEKKWCENCFDKARACLETGHNILLETSPYTFWCEKVSQNENDFFQKASEISRKPDRHESGKPIEENSKPLSPVAQPPEKKIEENSQARGPVAQPVENKNHLEILNNSMLTTHEIFQQAGVYFEGQEYEKALQYYSAYIEKNKENLKDPNLATSYKNLGEIYNNQREPKKALGFYFKALEICRSIHGDNHHADMATAYADIGSVYLDQGEYSKTIEYYLKCLEVEKSVYGENHIELYGTYYNIGMVYNQQEEYNKALEFYLRSLEIATFVYGDSHSLVVCFYREIAAIYKNLGDHKKAIEYYLKFVDTHKSVNKDKDPEIARAYNRIALAYRDQKEYGKGLEYSLKSLDILKSLYGENHLEIAVLYHNIGEMLHDLGEYKKAVEYHLKALEISKSVYADNHPSVTRSYQALATSYYKQGDDKKGTEYYMKSLGVQISADGDVNHLAENLLTFFQEKKEKDSAPSTEKEIIIKCSVEEIMKGFFKDYVVIWHDPEANNQENQQYIAQVKKFCEVFIFTEWEKAIDYIKTTQAVCHVVTSGTNGELLVKETFEKENVCNIYVFCENKEYHETWTKNYKKISSIETDIQNLINQIQRNLSEWQKKISSFNFNLPAFAPIFNGSDKSQMNHLHRFLKIIPKFKNREQAKEDFINLSKVVYTDSNNQRLLADFKTNYNAYNKEQTLKWYTLESFLYKVTNNCLRIATSDSIQYCRLPLKDIEQAIKDQYQAKSKNFNGLLYRGAYLSEKEWLDLRENQDKEIEMHGFLSVSKLKNVALNFMRSDPSKKVLITIIVPKGPSDEEQGFAEMEEFSEYPQEKEILFNVRSRFTVLETEDNYEYSETAKCRHLVLLYGAQGFRKFITKQSPAQDVSIPNVENISCGHCNAKSERLFVSLTENSSYCKSCITHGTSPFLCIPTTMDQSIVKVNGALLQNSSQNQTPFYGYRCSQCQAKNHKSYFICTDCNGKRWCENCFEESPKTSTCLTHNILLETSPYTFWCEKMSTEELNHLEFQNDLVEKGHPVFQQAQMYFESHQYEKAKEYYNLYIEKNKENLKEADLATSYCNLARIFSDQGDHEESLKYDLKCLDIRKSIYGEIHPLVASSYDSIGLRYHEQREFKTALDYYFKSLHIKKSGHSKDDPSGIALTYNNIGGIYSMQGDYNKALEYHFKTLEIEKSINGGNSPFVATIVSNIGLAYNQQREYKKAIEYYLESLDIRKSLYGDIHPEIASSFKNLGSAYEGQGENIKALEYYSKALDIRKSVYGDNHPDIAASYRSIGTIHHKEGEYDKALEYYLKGLNILKSTSGDDLLMVAFNSNIGDVYCGKGENSMALEYFLKSLDIQKSIYGDNHPDTATSYYNIGGVYEHQRDWENAFEYYKKALDIRKSFYGENHPDTADIYSSIGALYRKQGLSSQAFEYLLKCLEINKFVHENNHPKIAFSYKNLGMVHHARREYEKALEYYSMALEINRPAYGEQHPETIQTEELIQSAEKQLKQKNLKPSQTINWGRLPDSNSSTMTLDEAVAILKSKQNNS